jgi:cell filamentation protein
MNEQHKISIRFFDDREVRALWDEQNAKWWFSVLDIVAVLTDQNDYIKTRNYWKYLKARLKKENSEVVSATTQLKLPVPDGKKRLSDMLDYSGIIALGKQFPGKKANRFIEWFTYGDAYIDGKSMLGKRKRRSGTKLQSMDVQKGKFICPPILTNH